MKNHRATSCLLFAALAGIVLPGTARAVDFDPLRGIPRTLVRGGIANSPLRGQALQLLQRVDPTDVSPWSFSRYFLDKTMRINYVHVGDAKEEFITLDRVLEQGAWAGSLKNLIDDYDRGAISSRSTTQPRADSSIRGASTAISGNTRHPARP